MDRRRTGTSHYTSQRREADQVRILSGVFEGRTTGTPIGLADREHRPALARLREDQGPLPSGPRRLHVPAEVRLPRLPRRRPLVGARDGHARRGRRRSRANTCASARRVESTDTSRRWARSQLEREGSCAASYDESVLLSGPGARAGARSLHVEAARAGRLGRRARQRHRDRRAARARRAGLRPARCRYRARDDGHQCGEGRRDRRRIREPSRSAAANTATS